MFPEGRLSEHLRCSWVGEGGLVQLLSQCRSMNPFHCCRCFLTNSVVFEESHMRSSTTSTSVYVLEPDDETHPSTTTFSAATEATVNLKDLKATLDISLGFGLLVEWEASWRIVTFLSQAYSVACLSTTSRVRTPTNKYSKRIKWQSDGEADPRTRARWPF